MVANLLYYTGRTARWFTALGAYDIMCMAHAPHQGSNPCEPSGRPRLREGAATRSDLKGLHGGTSSRRYIWISSDLLKQLNGVLTMTGP